MVLVGYWPLNETSGDALDYAGSNNGTVNGATQGVTGILGNKAYDFDGGSDYVELGNTDIIGGETQATLSVWVNLDAKDQQARIVANDDNSSWQIQLSDSGDNFRTRWYGSGAWTKVAGPASTINEWRHLVSVFNEGTIEFYVDGILYGTANTGSTTTVNNNEAARIGSGRSSGSVQYPMNGRVCEFRMYNHALTAAEIQYLYETSQRGNLETRTKSA